MSQFPKARPSRGQKLPRRPRDWREHTHVCVDAGQRDWDDEVLCHDCGMRRSHRVHDLRPVIAEATELDARKLGEAQ